MQREKRIRERKKRYFLYLLAAVLVMGFLMYRQITQGVFSPLIKGAYYNVETDEKAVAVTFDVVWEPGETAEILKILDRYRVRATFFATGTWVRENPDLAREIITRGHELGQHGYEHKRLTELEDKDLETDFARMEEALREELNMSTALFRPPYGELDQRVFDYAKNRGYTTILWSIDPHDWLDPGKDKIISRVVKQLHNGAIILIHTNATQSVEALPVILQSLRMQEYEMLTVTELLEKEKR